MEIIHKMADSVIDVLISLPSHTPICVLAPSSLEELYKIVSDHIRIDSKLFEFMYDRKGTLFKIIDNRTYLSLIQKAIAQVQDELNLIIEFSNKQNMMLIEDDYENLELITSNQSISSILYESEVQTDQLLIYYKILNTHNSAQFDHVIINQNAKLIQLSDMILKNQIIVTPDTICALYSEDGYPITGSLIQMHFILCKEVLKNKEKLTIFVVPYFDVKFEPPINHEDGPVTLFLKHDTDESKKYAIRVDLTTTTVLKLKQKLFNASGIPTHELKIKIDQTYLINDSSLLSIFDIAEGE